MHSSAERILANVRAATTIDLLDRVTVYRDGMDPDAIAVIEEELQRRGVKPQEIRDHAARRDATVLRGTDGIALRCSFCHQPAVARGWGWHRLFGRIPLFPREFRYCEEHRPSPLTS